MDLIFVHGRDQQGKNPQKLQAQWEAALMRGWKKCRLPRPAKLNVIFPFYGDALARLVETQNATPPSGTTPKATAPGEAAFRGEFLQELARNAGVTDADIRAHYAGPPQERGPLNWEWVQAILQVLDHTPVGEASLDLFTTDVYAYLTNSTIRGAIDKIVADQFTGKECVVVAHSLGTVVTYNVLRALGANACAKRYVTIGSPLGVKAIQRHLVPPALTMPEGLPEWFNAYDERDVVALRPLDQETFPVTPPIHNRAEVKNRTENRHGVTGYLDDPEVARWIHEALSK